MLGPKCNFTLKILPDCEMFIQTWSFGHSEIEIYTLSINTALNASAIQSSAYHLNTT